MLQATFNMIDRVREETGLLVHHIISSNTNELTVRRMDHIHVEVKIPKHSWFRYVDANKANYISKPLRELDEKYITEVITQIVEVKYEVSPVIFNYLELNKPVAKYSHNVTKGTITVNYFDESRTFELAKLFKRDAYDRDYINTING